MFMCEQVLLGESINNTLCSMIFHCQTRLALATSSLMRQFIHGFFLVGLFPKACNFFGRPQTWASHKHICLCGNKFYWVSQSLTHFVTRYSLPDMCSKQYHGQATRTFSPCVFGFCILSQGLKVFGRPQMHS